MKNPFKSYIKSFSELDLWSKIKRYTTMAGHKTVYTALLLFYAYKRSDTPYWAKNIILGVLGYFIAPIDALPDLTPIIGYTDDVGVLGFGLTAIACYINQDVRIKARTQLKKWFKNYDEEDLNMIDEKL